MKKLQLETLITDYGRMVLVTCYRVLGNMMDAEDAAQNVFLTIAKDLDDTNKWDRIRNWNAYLKITATHSALKLAKKRIPVPRGDGDESVYEKDLIVDSTIRQSMDQKFLAGQLRQALLQLPERDAQVILCRYCENMPYEDIAAHMRISTDSVGVILHRSRKQLKQILEPLLKACPEFCF